MDTLHIHLLGEFSVRYQQQAISALNADRPQTMLAYLLLHRHAPQSRQQIAYTLWPDSTEAQARTNLRNLLFILRQSLPHAEHYLASDTHTLQWRPDAPFTLDVAEFEAALTASSQASTPTEQQQWLETAVSIYTGPLLPTNYDDWTIPLREALHHHYLTALRHLAALLEQTGQVRQAIPITRRLLHEDPLDETAVISLMRLHALLGDRAGLHRVYQAAAAALRQELDADPAPETQAAYSRLLASAADQIGQADREGETAVISPPPPARTSPRQATQLPPQNTPFIGRDVELARLAQLLANPDCRLITIVGPGGSGKTRLALQAATGHVTVFTHGAAFIPLAAISEPALLATTIAQALQLPPTATQSRQAQIEQYLRDREMLLVLDNMEQLRQDVALLPELLNATPGLKLLVTSRQRLALHEEWTFELGGLPLPDPNATASSEPSAAAALFMQAARRQDSTFQPTAADLSAIGQICTLVDGMPLALEIAATWVRLLSCAEIAAEIGTGLDFLTSSQKNLPERHRSMRAVFEHSWNLLSPEEQTAFSRLSLFRGGFDREGAEAVAAAPLPVLAALLDQSLVRRLRNGRYDIHELLRQFAAERLAADAHHYQTAQAGFIAYYLALAETAAEHLIGGTQQLWLERLDAEYANLRQVLGWLVAAADGETAVRMAVALGRFWWLRARPVEGSYWMTQILALPAPADFMQARALAYAGLLARIQQNYPAAEQWLQASIALQRTLGNKLDLGKSLNELGMIAMDRGEFDKALPLFTEWLELARQLNYPHGLSMALLNLGMVTHLLDNQDQAERCFLEGLALARQHDLMANVAMLQNSYGMLLLTQKRLPAARAALRESLHLSAALGYQEGVAWALLGLGTAAYHDQHWALAARLCGAADAVRASIGLPLPPANRAYFAEITTGLTQALGATQHQQEQAAGAALPLPTIIALASEGW